MKHCSKKQLLCLFTCIVLLNELPFAQSVAQDDVEFPYTLVVSSETADVLSGPGNTHYPTDRLPRGAKVQVYRHDPGGYYAVRPPTGSFSLVLASAVKPTTDPNIVEVKSNSAKAWIGSRLQGSFKPMWQLKLKPGELLNVVKKVDIPGALSNGSEPWYQVEPPRGEFRWIHKDKLGPQAPGSVSSAEIANQRIERSMVETDLLRQLGNAKERSQIASTVRSGWKVLETDPQRQSNVSANEAFFDGTNSSLTSFPEKIQALDIALSQAVLSPKQNWNLDSLQVTVEQLRKNAATGAELSQANLLAQKILSFQKIKLEALQAGTSAQTASLLTPNLNRSTQNSTASQIRYDGRGVLRKLYTNRGVGPAIYALEDEQGKVIKTITPSNGVNLERFVGKPVGLFGRSGFNQRLNRPHLTAQRVVDLNKIR